MPIEIERQLVLAWLDVQTLEPAVEIVHSARKVAVDEYLGLARCHLQPKRRLIVVEGERRAPGQRHEQSSGNSGEQ